MTNSLTDLIALLDLETIELNIFRGQSRDIGNPQVFGGQVLGQAITAASRTIEDRVVHSLHAYFLRRGDVDAPIVYEVDRARDGGSFSVRRVVAIQHGRPIFNMAASFQALEEGLEHQTTMPDVPGPEDLLDISEIVKKMPDSIPVRVRRFLSYERPFQVRPVRWERFMASKDSEPVRHVWFRAGERLPDDPHLHQRLIAYMSDYELLGTATLPHGLEIFEQKLQMASLDHAMWFHRPCRVDEWLLFSYDSPSASGARGLSRGQLFNEAGVLVASTAQEGLIRVRDN